MEVEYGMVKLIVEMPYVTHWLARKSYNDPTRNPPLEMLWYTNID